MKIVCEREQFLSAFQTAAVVVLAVAILAAYAYGMYYVTSNGITIEIPKLLSQTIGPIIRC